jgi:hypothetical protein
VAEALHGLFLRRFRQPDPSEEEWLSREEIVARDVELRRAGNTRNCNA